MLAAEVDGGSRFVQLAAVVERLLERLLLHDALRRPPATRAAPTIASPAAVYAFVQQPVDWIRVERLVIFHPPQEAKAELLLLVGGPCLREHSDTERA
jgi:hypothetical protein